MLTDMGVLVGGGEGCTALDIITTMELYAQNR